MQAPRDGGSGREPDGGASAGEDAGPATEGGVAVDTVLVPVDGSEAATAASEYAVAIADRYDAALHAVYVLGRSTVRAIDADAVDEDAVATAASEYLAGIEARAAEADVPLTAATAYGYSQTVKRQHPGSVILDVADEVDADFLVVPREHGQTPNPAAADLAGERDVLGRAAEYVLQYASQPVVSV